MKELILKADGQEITVYAEESELAKLIKPERARTGYERVAVGEPFYVTAHLGMTEIYEGGCNVDYDLYNNGNYVNSEQLGINRFRARVLHDKLEQWQALNDEPVDWGNNNKPKFEIRYDYNRNELEIVADYIYRIVNAVYFSTYEKVQEAIEAFHDELMWYFTEYRSRLDEKRTDAAE